ncbi:MAG: TonB-dependent receptor [Dysgonamonadaceae bacterium]|jgi:iron complex outermembrane receptor protein|nr:TonB-dependent receptor [Dysgonamonadaceae bacterium]
MKRKLLLAATLLHCFATFAESPGDSLKIKDLQEVQVISVRTGEKTPITYSNLDRSTIEANNFGQDIPYLLTLTPSVISTSDAGTGIGYTGFRIRGTDANRINVTANSVPLNDSESHGVFWVNMPDLISSLQDLQVQRGVGASTNGAGAFGASINMKTGYIPQEAYSEFNGSYGSFNTAKTTFKLGTGKIAENFTFDGRISSISSDGFIDRASVSLKSYMAQGAYSKNNTLVKFITLGGKERTYHAWDGVPKEILETGNRTYNPSGSMGNNDFYDNQTDNYLQTHYQLSLMQRLTDCINLNAALHYTKGAGYYEEYKYNDEANYYPVVLKKYLLKPFVNDAGEISENSDLVRQKHLDNDFYGGIFSLDYELNKLDISLGGGINKYDGNHWGLVKWVKNYAGDADFYPDHEYYRSKGVKTDANIYLKNNYSLFDNLNLYGDLQYRFIDYSINGKNDKWDKRINEMQNLNVDRRFDFFNPKAGIFYRINKYNNVYGSVAVAHREPNRNNYTDAGETEKPVAERLTDYELGYRFANGRFSVGLNVYYMLYKDQLVLTGKVNEIGELLTSNVPDSYRAGIELTASVNITPDLSWSGNTTLSDNRIKEFTEYVEDWETGTAVNYLGTVPIAFSPDIIAGSMFSYVHKGFRAALQSQYVGKQFMDNTGSADRSIDAYFVNNLRFGYDFPCKGTFPFVSVNLLVNNIFNEEYESNGYVWYTWYEGTCNDRKRGNDLRYFPQAGTNVMANIVIKF